MNSGILDTQKRNAACLPPNLSLWLLQLLHGGPSVYIYIRIFLIRAAALSNGQFKVLCVCWGPYAGWQMFIRQLAFHLSMENNGLALCPALSWANKASYLTSNQAIIHSTPGIKPKFSAQVAKNLTNFCGQRQFCLPRLLFVYRKEFNMSQNLIYVWPPSGSSSAFGVLLCFAVFDGKIQYRALFCSSKPNK